MIVKNSNPLNELTVQVIILPSSKLKVLHFMVTGRNYVHADKLTETDARTDYQTLDAPRAFQAEIIKT